MQYINKVSFNFYCLPQGLCSVFLNIITGSHGALPLFTPLPPLNIQARNTCRMKEMLNLKLNSIFRFWIKEETFSLNKTWTIGFVCLWNKLYINFVQPWQTLILAHDVEQGHMLAWKKRLWLGEPRALLASSSKIISISSIFPKKLQKLGFAEKTNFTDVNDFLQYDC